MWPKRKPRQDQVKESEPHSWKLEQLWFKIRPGPNSGFCLLEQTAALGHPTLTNTTWLLMPYVLHGHQGAPWTQTSDPGPSLPVGPEGGACQTPAQHVTQPQEQSKPGCGPTTLLGGPPRAAWLSFPLQTPPDSEFLAPRPLPRWPSQCLNLLLIPAMPTRPLLLPPSFSAPAAPPLAGPMLEPAAPPAPTWHSSAALAAAGRRRRPRRPRARPPSAIPGGPETCSTRPSVGECEQRAAGGASEGGGARSRGEGCHRSRPCRRTRRHPCCCAGPGRARGCTLIWAPAGAARGRRLLDFAGRASDPGSTPTRTAAWGHGQLADPRRLRPCPSGPGGCW